MASYVVMEPSGARGTVEDTVFVRDGFAFLAFLVPFFWFLWHRLWIEALATLALALLLGSLSTLVGVGAAVLISLAVFLMIGLEATNLRILALRRRGWQERGVVEAANKADAEARYFSEPESGEAHSAHDRPPPAPATAAQRKSGDPALGLLGYPGAR